MLKIKPMLNIEDPKIDPNGISSVEGEELAPAATAVITLGVPLASARKVIPASASDISE